MDNDSHEPNGFPPADQADHSAPAPDIQLEAEGSAPAPDTPPPPAPQHGIGAIVRHPTFGTGRVQSYEGNAYVILFKGGDTKIVSFDFAGLNEEERGTDPQMDRIKEAMREVLNDYGWLDTSIELGKRWHGGSVLLEPGKSGTQAKEIPMDVFFKKIIGVREKLRVLEQKINNHPSLNETEKMELGGYITRSYGSLTTFNSLFEDKASYFKGTGKSD